MVKEMKLLLLLLLLLRGDPAKELLKLHSPEFRLKEWDIQEHAIIIFSSSAPHYIQLDSLHAFSFRPTLE